MNKYNDFKKKMQENFLMVLFCICVSEYFVYNKG
jgi:hypothetical protein